MSSSARSSNPRENPAQLQLREVLKIRFAAPPCLEISMEQVRLHGGRVVDGLYQVKMMDYTGIFAEIESREVV